MHNTAEKLPKVTVVADMSNKEYHAHSSFGSSQLKDIIRHPPALFHAKHIAKTLEHKESDAMRLGSAVHSAFMEPEKFVGEFIVQSAEIKTRRGEKWETFKAKHRDKTILTQAQGTEVSNIITSLNLNHGARGLLSNALIENSIFWTDKETGLECRARPDIWRPERYIADLKTCQDASPEGFSKAIYQFGYHISAALYLDGANQVGKEITDFIFICVETSAPYLTAIYSLSEEAIEIGRRDYREALRQLKQCIKADRWAGYNDDEPTEITLPQWVLNKENI